MALTVANLTHDAAKRPVPHANLMRRKQGEVLNTTNEEEGNETRANDVTCTTAYVVTNASDACMMAASSSAFIYCSIMRMS